MESEINSGSTGGGFGHGPPGLPQKERKTLKSGNEQGRHHSTESDFAGGSSQLVGKKRRRENEGSPRPGNAENEEEACPDTIEVETILSNALEDIIQQRFERIDDYTHQFLGVLETGKAYLAYSSTTFEEGILQLQGDIERLENVDIGDEETSTRLREARDALEKLQASASDDLAFEPEPQPTAHEQGAHGR